MRISEEEEACGCRECNIFLHEACAKAPLEIQHHPFHPKHPLYLSYDSSCEGECHACRSPDDIPIRYRCEECKLIFHLSCVISTMPRDDDDDDEREDISRRPSLIDHPLHPHQLSSYHSKTRTKIECRICRDQIPSEDFFGCSDCSFFLHGSCAQPPIDAIQHYLHPEHTLTFAQCPDEKEHKCAVCGSLVERDSYCYTCQMCDLLIHPFCASATLSDLEKGVALTVQLPFHEHELKLYRNIKDFCTVYYRTCTVCNRNIWEKLRRTNAFPKDASLSSINHVCSYRPTWYTPLTRYMRSPSAFHLLIKILRVTFATRESEAPSLSRVESASSISMLTVLKNRL
ncbi:uncharacterized protein LOC104439903 [Eucalyptus grandis]|uniref:uncharacterized protein LOC104439903 n=1 Tax=Eucalyptus grandis TaxID=71139 RepID=UPI00192EDDA8|nr:uncharacterized protein LOC104439903 [Eucalyptus grandis]